MMNLYDKFTLRRFSEQFVLILKLPAKQRTTGRVAARRFPLQLFIVKIVPVNNLMAVSQ